MRGRDRKSENKIGRERKSEEEGGGERGLRIIVRNGEEEIWRER